MSEILKHVEEIEARASAATKGPWDWTYHPRSNNFPNDVMALQSDSANEDVLLCTGDSDISWGEISASDAAFIKHAREDIPALCATVRQLLEENENLKSLAAEALQEVPRSRDTQAMRMRIGRELEQLK